ncbi:MAG: ABC transporter substrate-binding protein [Gemmatimonadaceae bacterium]|nr:ABC transporter substrate-binding protein [Acetobacteraceae bacterium]
MNTPSRLTRRATLCGAALLLPGRARAQTAALPEVLRIGVLNDASGPFADQSGRGSVVAANLAVEDFQREAPGTKVEILYADHQNKADIGGQIARAWVDRDGVVAVADAVNSSVGLAVNDIMRERRRTFVASNVGTSDLTGRFCSPNTVQWTFDTWAFGNSAARAMHAQGKDSFFFIGFDYALGQALERDTTAILQKLGGRVAGSVKHPLGTTDFSSYLLQAQASGAKVVAFASTGGDFINAAKQAAEFGLTRSQTVLGLFTQIVDVDALGLQAAQGLVVTEAFYWDLNDGTRAFARRYEQRMPGRVPTENHAGVYSSVLAYLRAVRTAGSVDGERVVAAMRGMGTIDDPLFGPTTIRADGRAVHAMHVFRVKAPAVSQSRWDVYEPLATIPPADAFRPLSEGGCSLVGKT